VIHFPDLADEWPKMETGISN